MAFVTQADDPRQCKVEGMCLYALSAMLFEGVFMVIDGETWGLLDGLRSSVAVDVAATEDIAALPVTNVFRRRCGGSAGRTTCQISRGLTFVLFAMQARPVVHAPVSVSVPFGRVLTWVLVRCANGCCKLFIK